MAACVKESEIKKKKWRFIEAPITYETGEGPPAGYSQTMIALDSAGRKKMLQLVPVPNGNKSNMDIRYSIFALP